MKNKKLMEIALKHIEKRYDYEDLMDGDDLYLATPQEKEECGDYYTECRKIGTSAFEKKISETI